MGPCVKLNNMTNLRIVKRQLRGGQGFIIQKRTWRWKDYKDEKGVVCFSNQDLCYAWVFKQLMMGAFKEITVSCEGSRTVTIWKAAPNSKLCFMDNGQVIPHLVMPSQTWPEIDN